MRRWYGRMYAQQYDLNGARLHELEDGSGSRACRGACKAGRYGSIFSLRVPGRESPDARQPPRQGGVRDMQFTSWLCSATTQPARRRR